MIFIFATIRNFGLHQFTRINEYKKRRIAFSAKKEISVISDLYFHRFACFKTIPEKKYLLISLILLSF
jgi:predicted MPP superfamily phosphohydrolase